MRTSSDKAHNAFCKRCMKDGDQPCNCFVYFTTDDAIEISARAFIGAEQQSGPLGVTVRIVPSDGVTCEQIMDMLRAFMGRGVTFEHYTVGV